VVEHPGVSVDPRTAAGVADGSRAQFRAIERRGRDRLEEVGVLEVIGILARGDLRVVPVHRAGELVGGQA
jgi:hypothetical protein